jgi:Spy/CpxP family protein refolding chaperone
MRRSSFTIVLYLALVFISGLGVGAYGYRFITQKNPDAAKANPPRPSPEEFRKQYLNEMKSRLKLTPDQIQKLNVMMDETRSRFHEERQKHDAVMKTIRDQQTDKVRAMLTDAQRPEYEKLRAERDQRAKAAQGNR